MSRNKLKILIISKYFYPGYKAGGPIQSIKNLCDELSDYFEIYIIAKDRDVEDKNPYEGIIQNNWNRVNGHYVYYFNNLSLKRLKNIIENIDPDKIYLNSLLQTLNIKSNLLNKLFLKKNIVIAPRGELHKGALMRGKFKKNIFIYITKFLSLYKNAVFHSTDSQETKDIKKYFPYNKIIEISNLVKKPELKTDNGLNNDLIYISRVTPKKNLLFMLNVIKKLDIKYKINFDIYGPISDIYYWKKCQSLINQIDKNKVKVNYRGTIPNYEIPQILERYLLFILPTFGENFGHVIYESLSNSVPVLISDNTPWKNLQKYNAGFDLPLEAEKFEKALSYFLSMSIEERSVWKKGAYNFALQYYNKSENQLDEYKQMFK
jgi:glycosyltransferase involved in cell wall biosynthesis